MDGPAEGEDGCPEGGGMTLNTSGKGYVILYAAVVSGAFTSAIMDGIRTQLARAEAMR